MDLGRRRLARPRTVRRALFPVRSLARAGASSAIPVGAAAAAAAQGPKRQHAADAADDLLGRDGGEEEPQRGEVDGHE